MSAKEKRKTNIVLLILRIISIIVIIGCLIYIGNWYIENKKSANMIREITDATVKDTIYIDVRVTNDEGTEEEVVQLPVYELDFEKLLAINNRTVCWIKVPNTCIDYPVAQHSDNSFYLNHSFDKSWNSAGWIFADYRNKFDGTDKNIIMYGHNRMDSSMFATLRNTQNSSWFNNNTNKYLTLTLPNSTEVYEVFSVYTIKSETYYLTTDFASDEDYLRFLNTIKGRSIHNFNVNLSAEDRIVTLSTCDATGKSRVILHARKVM